MSWTAPTPPHEQEVVDQSSVRTGEAAGGIGGGILGAVIGFLAGGPPGAVAGATIGSSALSGVGGAIGATDTEIIEVPGGGGGYVQSPLPSYGGIAMGDPWLWEQYFSNAKKNETPEQNEQAKAFERMLADGYFKPSQMIG
tara:strand:+ start:108 stop:530 length:423 start_codon:yes stop_codon:yes gene_type:complete